LEPIEHRYWIVVIVIGVVTGFFAGTDFAAHYVPPGLYGPLFGGVAFLYMFVALAWLLRLHYKSMYFHSTLIGGWTRVPKLGFVIGEVGVGLMLLSYQNVPSIMSNVGSALAIFGMALMVLGLRKLFKKKSEYE